MSRALKDGGYECSFCNKYWNSPLLALACERSHKLIYIAIPKEELMRLIHFIYSKDDKFLTEDLVNRLVKYSKVKETSSDLSDMQE